MPGSDNSLSLKQPELDRTHKFLLVPVFLLLLGCFLLVARYRSVDLDEGFSLLASRLVLEHKTPYLDFFYQQAPLLPYAYGLWMKLFGISWFSARSFPAVLTAVLGLLIYQHVCHQTRRWIAGLAAVVLYVSSTLVLTWFPLAKTYSLASLFLFGAFVLVSRLSLTSPSWLVTVGGLLLGLSVDTRSYVVGLAPVFLWWILRNSASGHRAARIFWFLGGFAIAIAPSLVLFAASPDRFLFNNLGYHAMRSDDGLIGAWGVKLYIARAVFFGSQYNGFQISLLSVLALVGILVLRPRRGAATLAFVMALVLGIISILPTPPMQQYFVMCMPFIIVAAVCTASDYVASLDSAPAGRLALLASAGVLAAFVLSSIPRFRQGDLRIDLPGARHCPEWSLESVSAVSHAIDQLAAPNEKILSCWPAYIFASKADPYPGLENEFGRAVSMKLTPEQKAKYHIIGRSEIEAGFAEHRPRIAVVRNRIPFLGLDSAAADILRFNGYTAVTTIGGTSVFVCCSRP